MRQFVIQRIRGSLGFHSIVILLSSCFVIAVNFRPKDLRVILTQPCATAANNPINFDALQLRQRERNQYYLTTSFYVTETIGTNLTFRMNVATCPFDRRQCVDRMIESSSICEKLADRNALWTPLLDKIEPVFQCPIQKGTYKINNGSFDISLISHVPMDPQNIYVNITFWERLIDTETHLKKNRQIFCLDALVAITQAKSSNRRRV